MKYGYESSQDYKVRTRYTNADQQKSVKQWLRDNPSEGHYSYRWVNEELGYNQEWRFSNKEDAVLFALKFK